MQNQKKRKEKKKGKPFPENTLKYSEKEILLVQ